MSRCPSCFSRTARWSCPVLAVEICPICCLERRRDLADCPAGCRPGAVGDGSPSGTACRHGVWLAPRLRAFSSREEVYTAVLDLEETISWLAGNDPEVTDLQVLEALDHLAGVDLDAPGAEPPNELAGWLEECLRSTWELDEEGEGFPPLLMLGLLPRSHRVDTLARLRDIIGGAIARGGYLAGAAAYFKDLREAAGRRSGSESSSPLQGGLDLLLD